MDAITPAATPSRREKRRLPAGLLIVLGVLGVILSVTLQVVTIGLLEFLTGPLLKLSLLVLGAGVCVVGARRVGAKLRRRLRRGQP